MSEIRDREPKQLDFSTVSTSKIVVPPHYANVERCTQPAGVCFLETPRVTKAFAHVCSLSTGASSSPITITHHTYCDSISLNIFLPLGLQTPKQNKACSSLRQDDVRVCWTNIYKQRIFNKAPTNSKSKCPKRTAPAFCGRGNNSQARKNGRVVSNPQTHSSACHSRQHCVELLSRLHPPSMS